MRASERPSARLRVRREHRRGHRLHDRAALRIPELPDVVLDTRVWRGRPPEEDVARALEHALPAHHALAVVQRRSRVTRGLRRGSTRLLDLEEERTAVRSLEQDDEATRPDAADAHD